MFFMAHREIRAVTSCSLLRDLKCTVHGGCDNHAALSTDVNEPCKEFVTTEYLTALLEGAQNYYSGTLGLCGVSGTILNDQLTV